MKRRNFIQTLCCIPAVPFVPLGPGSIDADGPLGFVPICQYANTPVLVGEIGRCEMGIRLMEWEWCDAPWLEEE